MGTNWLISPRRDVGKLIQFWLPRIFHLLLLIHKILSNRTVTTSLFLHFLKPLLHIFLDTHPNPNKLSPSFFFFFQTLHRITCSSRTEHPYPLPNPAATFSLYTIEISIYSFPSHTILFLPVPLGILFYFASSSSYMHDEDFQPF